MVAYIIFNRLQTTDATELAHYPPMVAPTLKDYDATKLVGGGQVKVLEGEPSEAVVILEFPSFEEAETWYNSPLYKKATIQRLKGGKWHVMIVEGV